MGCYRPPHLVAMLAPPPHNSSFRPSVLLTHRNLRSDEGRKLPVGEITAGELPQLVAGRHLPLCMTVMYERLASEHHLKHWGLQQLSLFLKAIGLPLEQAMLFWRQQFAPRSARQPAGACSLGSQQ